MKSSNIHPNCSFYPSGSTHDAVYNPYFASYTSSKFLYCCLSDHFIHARHSSTSKTYCTNFASFEQSLGGFFHLLPHKFGGRIMQLRSIQSCRLYASKLGTAAHTQKCRHCISQKLFPYFSSRDNAETFI